MLIADSWGRPLLSGNLSTRKWPGRQCYYRPTFTNAYLKEMTLMLLSRGYIDVTSVGGLLRNVHKAISNLMSPRIVSSPSTDFYDKVHTIALFIQCIHYFKPLDTMDSTVVDRFLLTCGWKSPPVRDINRQLCDIPALQQGQNQNLKAFLETIPWTPFDKPISSLCSQSWFESITFSFLHQLKEAMLYHL